MADTEGFNLITNGATLIVGVDAFQIGTIAAGAGIPTAAVGQPIYAAINGIRVNDAPASNANPVPTKNPTAEASLATIANNTTAVATAAAQTTGNTSLAAIATAETAGNVSLATIATAQGNAANGIAQPTGGLGVLGFISGIYNALVNTLTVSGTVTANDGGAAGNGIAQPTGGTGLMGFISGIYNALVNSSINTKAVSRTGAPPDITTTGAANTAQNIFNAGSVAAGGYFIPSAAGVVNQVGTAITTVGGANIAAAANVPYDLAPLPGAVSFISATGTVTIQGLALR